jgi:hypothetical protein
MFRSFVVFVVGIWLLAKAWSPVAHFWYQHRNDPRIQKIQENLQEAAAQGADWAGEQLRSQLLPDNSNSEPPLPKKTL